MHALSSHKCSHASSQTSHYVQQWPQCPMSVNRREKWQERVGYFHWIAWKCIQLRLCVWIFSLLYILISCDSDQQKTTTNNECGVLNVFMIVRARLESTNLSSAADSVILFYFIFLRSRSVLVWPLNVSCLKAFCPFLVEISGTLLIWQTYIVMLKETTKSHLLKTEILYPPFYPDSPLSLIIISYKCMKPFLLSRIFRFLGNMQYINQ